MALQRTQITNNNQSWSAKKRYKVNEVVTDGGNVYQNFTGGNSTPSLGTDWLFLKSTGFGPGVYHVDFIADATQKFTVPATISIHNVFLNNVSATGASWSQTGTEVTVTSSVVGDLVTLTN